MENKRLASRRYITGFGGLRALSVVGIILYHLNPDFLKGGYLGVAIFFALSGYLITDLLRQEWLQNGFISLIKFYQRRLKRLYPALFTMIISTSAYILLFQRDLINNLRGSVLSSLLYVNNWWQINRGLSYFARFTTPSPYTHIWYLAVEAQNYLIWPILFILLVKLVKKRSTIFYTIVGASLISVILMAVLYSGENPSRVYYGTDTRIFGIWLGAALAFIWPTTGISANVLQAAKTFLNTIGAIAFLGLVLAFFEFDDQSPWMYRGGFLLVTLLSLILIAVVAHPAAIWNRLLSNPLFKWIDQRSYGIYLYQFPVLIFYEAKVDVSGHRLLHGIIEVAIILLCAELSYRFVEHTKRAPEKNLVARAQAWLALPFNNPRKIKQLVAAVVTLLVFIQLFTLPTNYVTANQKKLEDSIAANKKLAAEKLAAAKKKALEKEKATAESSSSATAETTTSSTTASSTTASSTTASSAAPPAATVTLTAEQQATATKYSLTPEEIIKGQDMQVSAVGDSIILGSLDGLTEIFPNVLMDGEVGRQLYNSGPVFQSLIDQGVLQDNVVVSLGSNSPFSEAQFDSVMQIIGSTRRVFWLNINEPDQGVVTAVNTMLTQMAAKYANITLLDWNALSAGHDDWFYDDKIHPNPEGTIHYINLISKALLQ